MKNTRKTAYVQLLQFARTRPHLDSRNYGGDGAAYRREARQIAADLRRVHVLAAEAEILSLTDEEIIPASTRAFSGRLTWAEDHWEYCTGQYYPTEYRKAVAAVLDEAIHKHKQAHADDIRHRTVRTSHTERRCDVRPYARSARRRARMSWRSE